MGFGWQLGSFGLILLKGWMTGGKLVYGFTDYVIRNIWCDTSLVYCLFSFINQEEYQGIVCELL